MVTRAQVDAGRRVVVRTHGGLGNQIFQILYASLAAEGRGLRVVHDMNYPHRFELSPAFVHFSAPGPLERQISRLRIPKVLERIGLSSRGEITAGRTIYADGYFQDVAFYEAYGKEAIRDRIGWLRELLGLRAGAPRGNDLFHIRLGDFFATEEEQLDHLRARLAELPHGASIITNRDDLVDAAIKDAHFADKRLSLVRSEGGSAEDALRTMGEYRTIFSNNSTLAFWAACLADRALMVPSSQLNELYRLFTDRADEARFGCQ